MLKTMLSSHLLHVRRHKLSSPKVRRLKAKTLAESRFLSRKVVHKAKTVVDRFPDIGQAIETLVSESNVGGGILCVKMVSRMYELASHD